MSARVLAHVGGADEGASAFLLLVGVWVAWVAWKRLRGNAFSRLPRSAAWAMLPGSIALVVAAVLVPPILFGPSAMPTSTDRPSTRAELAFLSPRPGQEVAGSSLRVVIDLRGGEISSGSSTVLQSDEGHLHVSLDGELQSMTFATTQAIDVTGLRPGTHELEAEFVASDHAPFAPRVIAETTFEVTG